MLGAVRGYAVRYKGTVRGYAVRYKGTVRGYAVRYKGKVRGYAVRYKGTVRGYAVRYKGTVRGYAVWYEGMLMYAPFILVEYSGYNVSKVHVSVITPRNIEVIIHHIWGDNTKDTLFGVSYKEIV